MEAEKVCVTSLLPLFPSHGFPFKHEANGPRASPNGVEHIPE